MLVWGLLMDNLGLHNENRAIQVLHVDDDLDFLEVSKKILTLWGNFEIEQATSVDEAFKKLKTHRYDIVISDYEMPLKNGLDFLKELEAQRYEIPFILFTGKGREEVAIKALNLGAEGYYNKQGSPETVFGELAHGISLISDRSQVRNKLRYSEEKFSKAFRNSPDAIFLCTLSDQKVVEANKAAEKLWGYTIDEMVGYSSLELKLWVNPTERQRFYKLLNENGKVENFEITYLMKNGEIKIGIAAAETMELGGEKYFQALIRDVTEEKRAEENLIRSEQRYRVLFETVIDGIMVATIEGFVVSANPALASILGYDSVEELLTVPAVAHYANPLDRQVMFELLIQKGFARDYEVAFKKKNGECFDAMISVVAQRDSHGTVIGAISIIRDITERKKAVAALVESEAKYRDFADSLPEIVFEADSAGKPTFVNKKAVEITGYSVDEISKMTIFDFLVPEDRLRAKENIQKLMRGEKTGCNEYILQRKDGSIFPTMVFSERINVESGKIGLRGVMVNISDAKSDYEKLKALIEELRVAEALIRHDVGNKLAVIKTTAYLLGKEIGDNPKVRKYLEGINSAANDADTLFEFIRTYEKIGSEQTSSVNVEACFNESVALFPILKGRIKVLNECKDLYVMADSLLRQVFYNLIDNSLKHGEKVSKIRLSYEKSDHGTKLVYEDDGIGISDVNKPRLFTEGFTVGNGSGFGLKLVRRMVEVYGWKISEEGESGKGARFVITIPKISKNAEANYKVPA